MAAKHAETTLTTGNIVYLYGVLRDAVGCGKQTFITHIETALDEAGLAAGDIGFESTQQLLEALGPCVKLTVFKGGRVYATVIEQPEWDAALDAPDKKQKQACAKGNKPWKRKKGDKAIKPARPKRVKRDPDPEPEPLAAAPSADAARPSDAPVEDAGQQPVPSGEPAGAERRTGTEADIELRNGNFSLTDPQRDAADGNDASTEPVDARDESEAAAPVELKQAPAVSVTVTYDPYTGIDAETVLESTPGQRVAAPQDPFMGRAMEYPDDAPEPNGEPTPRAAAWAAHETSGEAEAEADSPIPATPEPEAEAEEDAAKGAAGEREPLDEVNPETGSDQAAEAAPEAKVAKTPQPEPLPEGLPIDFATDVYCPGPLLHQLTMVYPYGADVLGIVTEYFHIACDARTIVASRRRASFPVRYLDGGERKALTVKIERRSAGSAGAPWAITDVAAQDDAE